MTLEHEDYLGDGLYVAFDGYQIILATNDKVGGNPTDSIALEPQVIRAFENYLIRLRSKEVSI